MKKMITALLVFGLIAFTSNVNAAVLTVEADDAATETVVTTLIWNNIQVKMYQSNFRTYSDGTLCDVYCEATADYPLDVTIFIRTSYYSNGENILEGPTMVLSSGSTGGSCSCSNVQPYDFWLSDYSFSGPSQTYEYSINYGYYDE